MTTFRLRVWTRYFAPPEAVWAVKTDPARLAAEFHPYLHLSVPQPQPLLDALREARPGRAEGRLWPWGLSWPLDVLEIEPCARYRDRSENRLYRRFEHTHLFEPTPDGCRYIDDVVFTPALPGPKLAAILTRRLFVHRHRVAARLLPADERTIGTSVLRVLIEEHPEEGTDAAGD